MEAIFADLDSADETEQEEDAEDAEGEGSEDLEALRRTVQETLGPVVERKRKARTHILDEAVPESQYNLPAGDLDASMV